MIYNETIFGVRLECMEYLWMYVNAPVTIMWWNTALFVFVFWLFCPSTLLQITEAKSHLKSWLHAVQVGESTGPCFVHLLPGWCIQCLGRWCSDDGKGLEFSFLWQSKRVLSCLNLVRGKLHDFKRFSGVKVVITGRAVCSWCWSSGQWSPRERVWRMAGVWEGKIRTLMCASLLGSALCSSSLWMCCIIWVNISLLLHVDNL